MWYDPDFDPLNPRRLFDPTKDLGREYRERNMELLKALSSKTNPLDDILRSRFLTEEKQDDPNSHLRDLVRDILDKYSKL